MKRQDMLETLAQMMAQAENLARQPDPVLQCEMPRIAAILHEARQLLDENYHPLTARSLYEAIEG
jgi:hypothetical protein